MQATSGTTLDHNTIYNSGRNGINIVNTNSNFDISSNDISRFGFLTRDLGGIYTNSIDAGSSSIDGNVIHDGRLSTAATSGDPTLAGIYLDEGSTGFTVLRNVVHDVPYGAVLNKPSTNNSVVNNTFWNNSSAAMSSQFSGDFSVATYNNLANRNSFTGSDQQHNLYTTTDPFVNSAAGDYRLKNPSAPIDYGIVVPGLVTTYTGAAPDAGAIEYGSSNLTAGANFKAWTFGNQTTAPLSVAATVKYDNTLSMTGNLQVGNPTTTSGSANLRRAFVQFGLPNITGQIDKAVLRIYETSGANNANGSVNLYQLTSSWDGTFAGLANGSLVGTGWDAEGLELYNDIDVTAIVAGWLANPSSNYGFSLIGSESGDNRNTAKYFDGFYGVTSPQLVVTYTVPEPGILALLGTGLTALLAYAMRRRKEDRMSGGG